MAPSTKPIQKVPKALNKNDRKNQKIQNRL